MAMIEEDGGVTRLILGRSDRHERHIMSILWADDAPIPSAIKILNAQPFQQVVQVLGHPVGVFVHWAGRTVPCHGVGCAQCGRGERRYWAGYAPALHAVRKMDGDGNPTAEWEWIPVLLNVPMTAREQFIDPFIVGAIITFKNVVKGNNKKFTIVRTQGIDRAKVAELPTIDVKAELERMWYRHSAANVTATPHECDLLPFERKKGANNG